MVENYVKKQSNIKYVLHLILQLGLPMLIVVLSGDLLYLYFGKSWSDPIKIIEYLEVGLLGLFTLSCGLLVVKRVIYYRKHDA